MRILAATALGDSALAVVVALFAALLYTAASAMQQRANLVALRAADTSHGAKASAAGAAVHVALQPMWIGGLVLTLGGFGLQAVALSLGAISLVQPVFAIAIVLMVPTGAWVVGGRVTGHEWRSASLVLAGIAVFLALAQPQPGLDAVPAGGWWPVLLVGGALFACLLAAGAALTSYRAALYGCAAGVWVGMLAALLKQATASGISLANWAVYAALAFGALNVLWVNLAMRAGRLATAQATLNALQPVVALAIGLTVFGETLAAGPAELARSYGGCGVGTWC